MERYSEYKDSGVKWLGEIPSHWEVRKIIGCFSENKKKNTNFTYTHAMQFNYGTIVDKNEGFDTTEAKSIYSNYALINKGDIVINGLNLNYDFISQRVAISPKDGIITSAYVVISPRENVNPYYFCYLFKDMDNMKMFHGMGSGVRKTLSFKELRNQLIPIPTVEEQNAIVRYLDAATSKIDKAIAMQQKMIDLLNERKQIIIQNAVTKGLDKNVEMKDSGVECLGLIPSHWKVIGWNHIFENLDKLREPISAEQRSRNNPKYDYYGASGVIDKIDYYNVDDKVLLIGEDGANLKMRNLPLVYKASGKIWVNNHAHILKPKVDSYDYMAYLMELFDYNPYITGSAQPKLSQEQLGTIRLCVPTIDEQNKIAIHLNRHLHGFDSAISNCQRQITLLQERKQIIINEVVTGKVKVS